MSRPKYSCFFAVRWAFFGLVYFQTFVFTVLCRFFYEFLLANERHVAKEVRDEYVDTMSKVNYSYFKGYISRLMKLQVRYSINSLLSLLCYDINSKDLVTNSIQTDP